MRRPNVAFGWAAGDLAVGGSTGSPDVAQSEHAGGVEARIPDAPVGARPRNGAAAAPLSPTQLATLLGHQYRGQPEYLIYLQQTYSYSY